MKRVILLAALLVGAVVATRPLLLHTLTRHDNQSSLPAELWPLVVGTSGSHPHEDPYGAAAFTSIQQTFFHDWNATMRRVDGVFDQARRLDPHDDDASEHDGLLSAEALAAFLAQTQADFTDRSATAKQDKDKDKADVRVASQQQLTAAAHGLLLAMTGGRNESAASRAEFSRYTGDLLTEVYDYYPAVCNVLHSHLLACANSNATVSQADNDDGWRQRRRRKRTAAVVAKRVEIWFDACGQGITRFSRWRVEQCVAKGLECQGRDCAAIVSVATPSSSSSLIYSGAGGGHYSTDGADTARRCQQASNCFLSQAELAELVHYTNHTGNHTGHHNHSTTPANDQDYGMDFAGLPAEQLGATLLLECLVRQTLDSAARWTGWTFSAVDTSVGVLVGVLFNMYCPQCVLVFSVTALAVYVFSTGLGWYIVDRLYPRSHEENARERAAFYPDLMVPARAAGGG